MSKPKPKKVTQVQFPEPVVMDREFAALSMIVAALDSLERPVLDRVLGYVASRYGLVDFKNR